MLNFLTMQSTPLNPFSKYIPVLESNPFFSPPFLFSFPLLHPLPTHQPFHQSSNTRRKGQRRRTPRTRRRRTRTKGQIASIPRNTPSIELPGAIRDLERAEIPPEGRPVGKHADPLYGLGAVPSSGQLGAAGVCCRYLVCGTACYAGYGGCEGDEGCCYS